MFKNKNIKSTILSLFLAFGMIAAFLLGVDVKKDFLSDESTALESLQEEIDNTLEKGFCIYFLDVGQADAALVECDGHYMMIDGGNAADSGKIYTILKEKQIDYLDLVIASHAHEDHVGGLAGALNFAKAGKVLCPTEEYDTDEFCAFKKYAELNGNGIVVPEVGDSFVLGSAQIDILGVNEVEAENDSSIILKIIYGETSFVFTGDAELAAEQAVLGSGTDLTANVLKVGHHGSDTSTSYPFLREIMPEYAVISVGADNAYGHPTETVLSRLNDAEAVIYRTDMWGDIICRSDGVRVTFEGSLLDNTTVMDSKEQKGEKYYILNVKSRKFHYPDCESVSKMAEKNKSEFWGERDVVLEQGYKPCGNCNP